MPEQRFEARIEGFLPVSIDRAWEALATEKGFSKVYEGIKAEGDWRVGGAVIWSGEWEGKSFRDEGTILTYSRPTLFVYTYWTSFWGLPNTPENTQTISNAFAPAPNGTKVTIVQSNIASAQSRDQSEKNWKDILVKLADWLK